MSLQLSIVIPLCNIQHNIIELLESVFTYQGNDVEVIVVSDSTAANNLPAVQQLAIEHSQLRFIQFQEGSGVAYARNIGMQKARGDYLWFLDSGNVLFEHAIPEILRMVTEHPCDVFCIPSVACLPNTTEYCRPFTYERDAHILTTIPNFVTSIQSAPQLFHVSGNASNKVVSRNFLEEKGIMFPTAPRYESVLFSYACLVKAKGIYSGANFCADALYIQKEDTVSNPLQEELSHIFRILTEIRDTYLVSDYAEGFDFIIATMFSIFTQSSNCIDESFKVRFYKQSLQFLHTLDFALVQSYFSSSQIRSFEKDAPFTFLWEIGYLSNKRVFDNKLIVSLIVASYNTAKWLDQTFEFLQNLPQDTSFLEILIVDDASTDGSVAYFKKLEEQYPFVKLHVFEENTIGGVGIPANYGIRQAKGEIVAFLDSDDMLHWNKFIKEITRIYLFDVDMLVFDYENYLEKQGSFESTPFGAELRRVNQSWSYQDIRLRLFHTQPALCPAPWCKFYKRSYLITKHIFFPEADYFHEDLPFHWFALSQTKRIHVTDSVVYIYRKERDGQTIDAYGTQVAAYAALYHLKCIKHFLIAHQLLGLFQNAIDENVLRTMNTYRVFLHNQADITFQFAQIAVNLPKSNNFLHHVSRAPSIKKQLAVIKHERTELSKKLEDLKASSRKQLAVMKHEKEELNQKFQQCFHNRWYQFGLMSRKRKIWVIGKVLAKKLHIYWLLKPFAKFVRSFFMH